MDAPLWGLLDVIVWGMDPESMCLHCWPWYESLDHEETRAKEAGMLCRWVCADGCDVAMARAELELQPSCLGGEHSRRELLWSPTCAADESVKPGTLIGFSKTH